MKPDLISAVYYQVAAEPLSRDEVAETIGTALDASPRLQQALRQVLSARLGLATIQAADDRLTERQSGHAGGRLHEIANLQSELQSYLEKAQTVCPSGRAAKVR